MQNDFPIALNNIGKVASMSAVKSCGEIVFCISTYTAPTFIIKNAQCTLCHMYIVESELVEGQIDKGADVSRFFFYQFGTYLEKV